MNINQLVSEAGLIHKGELTPGSATCVAKVYEEDRRYREWKDNPCDETLEKLYHAIERRALRMVVSRMHRVDTVAAADLAAHALLGMYVKYTPQKNCKFSTWLTRMLLRRVLDVIRDDPRVDEVSLEEAPGTLDVESHDAEALRARQQVCALLRTLKGLNRRILVGKLRGLSELQIAELCRLTPKAVERRWDRIRKNVVKNGGF